MSVVFVPKESRWERLMGVANPSARPEGRAFGAKTEYRRGSNAKQFITLIKKTGPLFGRTGFENN